MQIAALESELENVRLHAEQFEEEMAEESQGVDVQLMASQVAEYNQLKAKAGKKTTMLKEQLRLVSWKLGWRFRFQKEIGPFVTYTCTCSSILN